MISLQLKDTKKFMSLLLVKDTFDSFLLTQADIATSALFSIDGKVNRAFFTDEEYEQLPDSTYIPWRLARTYCFDLIKGNKVPTGMKIIFAMPHDCIERIISESDADITVNDFDGLFVNIRYKDNIVTIVTGVSIKTFSLDKSLDHSFDEYIKSFFIGCGLDYEQL